MLTVFYGAMKSGKSEELIRVINNYKFEMKEKKLFICKPSFDDRDNNCEVVSSRNGGSINCNWTWQFNDDDFPPEFYQSNAVFIDECQFLPNVLVKKLKSRVVTKHIYCAGLRTDFKDNAFKPMAELLSIATHIREVRSLCSCGNKAIKNQRITESGDVVTNGNSIQIGNNYVARCINCFEVVYDN